MEKEINVPFGHASALAHRVHLRRPDRKTFLHAYGLYKYIVDVEYIIVYYILVYVEPALAEGSHFRSTTTAGCKLSYNAL